MNKKNLSKKLQDILSTATPKQKALLVCKDYSDRGALRLEPLLTEDEVTAIKNSLSTYEEKKDYNKWIAVYNVYNDFTPYFGLVYKEYESSAEKLLGYLKQWEAYDQEENHLITIYEGIKEAGGKNVSEAFFKALSHLNFTDAKLAISEDGYPEIDIADLYRKIEAQAETVRTAYKAAKAIVIVMDEYTKKTRSSKFRPDIMKYAIDTIKEDYALNVAPRYSRKLLQEKKDKGLRVTPEEEKRAVYPSYDEIDPTELLDMFRKRLNYSIQSYAK